MTTKLNKLYYYYSTTARCQPCYLLWLDSRRASRCTKCA